MIRIIYISNKPIESDFRMPIIAEITSSGCCDCIAINRKENSWLVTEISNGLEKRKIDVINFPSLSQIKLLAPKLDLVFDSTGATKFYESLGIALNFKCPIILDYFDELKYNLKGVSRVKRSLELFLYKCSSDIVLYLSPKLYLESQNIFYKTYLIDNYKNVDPSIKFTTGAKKKFGSGVLIGNIDSRIDYIFLTNLLDSCLVTIDIFGKFLDQDAESEFKKFSDLNSGKVTYKGPYLQNEVAFLIQDYSVGLLPYNDSKLKAFGVRPDKLNTYLSVGLDVISAGCYGLDGFDVTEKKYFSGVRGYLISGKSFLNISGPLSKSNVAFQLNTIFSLLNGTKGRHTVKLVVYKLLSFLRLLRF